MEELKSIKIEKENLSLFDKLKKFLLEFFGGAEEDTLFYQASIALDKLLNTQIITHNNNKFFEDIRTT